jgi:hypothetical protein
VDTGIGFVIGFQKDKGQRPRLRRDLGTNAPAKKGCKNDHDWNGARSSGVAVHRGRTSVPAKIRRQDRHVGIMAERHDGKMTIRRLRMQRGAADLR